MKKFIYEARDQATNKIVKSTVQADTENAAAKLLIKQGFVPISIKEEGDSSSFFARLSGRITTKDKVVLTRQLATLISAGLPLTQSLHTVVEQTQNKKLQSIIQDVTASVEGGKSLSDSFKKFPEVFDNLFLALVSAGEASGTLSESLQRIANQQEKDAAMMAKIRGAMTYPVIVLIVIGAVLGFMLFTVVPQVENLYADLDKELPILTKILVASAAIIGSYWWIVLAAVIALVYFIRQYIKTEAGIKTTDRLKLTLPIIGKMSQKLYMARFTRTGQTLLSSGVSMLDTLTITAQSVNNVIISDIIIRASEKVRGGKALSASLQKEDYILSLVPQMISIGEKSGKIDEMLGKTAQVYEDELDDQIKNISTAIEPVLMVILAIVAGGMVGAVLVPIYSLVGGMNI